MLSKKDLWIMILNTSSELEAEVLDIILNEVEEDEEVDKYLDNVLEYGCQSGCVSSLIYHKDCEKFVKEHLSEVLDIYNETRECSSVIPEELTVDYLAWLAFERVCNDIKNNENLDNLLSK